MYVIIANMMLDKKPSPQTKFSNLSPNTLFPHIKLSTDQSQVMTKIVNWLRQPPSQYLTVGGYAGTGKTTLISLLRKQLHLANPKLKIGFASFTGRAGENLRNRLFSSEAIYQNDSCGTIHRLIYKPQTNDNGQVISWQKIERIDKDLIIIDEASMVTAEIWQDLLSYHIPIIAFGDHGQLPPIGDSFNLMLHPHLKLEKIHRQSQKNPILNLATKSRLGKPIPTKSYSPQVKKMDLNSPDSYEFCQTFFENLNNECLVLAGMNSTRVKLNRSIREAKRMESPEPMTGDKVVCLKNIYDNDYGDIYNGMIGTLSSIKPYKNHWYHVTIDFLQERKSYEGKISKYQFNQTTPLREVAGLKPEEIGDLFDFGYALTVHKAQGSEAKKVLIIDESHIFNKRDPDQGRKWLYTAITRAEEELYIVG